MPAPNAFGWNRSAVTITLSAVDENGGSGLRETHYSLSGAQAGADTLYAGNAISVTAEGLTTISYFSVDKAGNREQTKQLAISLDVTSPTLSGLAPDNCKLWPPNHQMVAVANISAADNLSGIDSLEVSATSSEPENGTGDGNTSPDIVIQGGMVQLRAERSTQDGTRVYTIRTVAKDKAGNVNAKSSTCIVENK